MGIKCTIFQESPFADQGDVVEILTDWTVWMGIRKVIDTININVEVQRGTIHGCANEHRNR